MHVIVKLYVLVTVNGNVNYVKTVKNSTYFIYCSFCSFSGAVNRLVTRIHRFR